MKINIQGQEAITTMNVNKHLILYWYEEYEDSNIAYIDSF
jgi:hypothetical protein